jgi:alpha-ketoglutarate-dependent 2,4-dichlorophenoxyacetate dioxygenase
MDLCSIPVPPERPRTR